MVSWKVKVTNSVGLHMRPACRICEEALKFKSDIRMIKGSQSADAKSLISMLAACVRCGDEVEFACSGTDEEEALGAIKAAAGDDLFKDIPS